RARTLAAGLAVAAAGALGLAAGLRMGERSPPLFQQLTFGRGHVTSARFAPDGATIVYSAGWDGAPFILYRKDPQGAGSLPLQLPAGWLQAVSPRGTALVVTGARGAPLQVVLPGRPVGTLAEGPLDGGAARELLEEVQFADWDPGGSSMVVVHEQAARTVLQLPPGHTLFATSGWISYPRVSRAGDLVAFLEHPVRGVERGRVIVIDRQGTEKLRTPMWAVTKGLAWSPRGNEVWFGASPGEALRSIYAVGLDGRTRLLLRGPGPLALHDVAASGDALVARETRHIGIAALLPGGAVRDLSWMDAAMIGDLSDDGSTLLFTEFGEAGGLYYSTYSRSISGSPAMRLGDGFASALSPDGAMALALIPKLPPELVLLPTRAGPQRRVQPSGLATYHSAGFMPGGQRILIAGHEPDKGVRLYVQDLGGGRPRAISPEHLLFTDHYNGFPVSPDGRWVAAADWQGEIDLHATDGTLTRVVHGLGPGTLPIRWTRDGRGLYAFRPHEVPARIMRLDVAEAAPPREWLRIAPADPAGVHIFPALRLSADGRTCVYSYVRLLTELYLVKGLR
ncbi:MAG TPA: hypothetical protein VFO85_03865, partial [Vicinamibacteria bacterium]|nr:hypothetical protein [Vicinamibacteria bacterium]